MFFNLWFYNCLVLAYVYCSLQKYVFFLKTNKNISLLSFFGPVFTPKASEENVGKDTFQFLTKK